MKKKALYPGSFDPITKGHLDIIRRSSKLFDKVVIGIFKNSTKSKSWFSDEEKIAMIKETLEKENIEFPDLAIFMSNDKEHFIEQSRIMRNGNSYYAPTDYYISLLKKGYIAGFFDKPNIFELWLTKNLDNYPANEEIFPLPEKYS